MSSIGGGVARKNVEPIQIYVPTGAKEQIRAFAKAKGFDVLGDYVRGLIQYDMAQSGEVVDLDVDRGGDRRSQDEPIDE